MPGASSCSSRARCPARAAATWSCGLRSRSPSRWSRPPRLRPRKPRRSLPSPPRRHRNPTRRRAELKGAMELKMVNDKGAAGTFNAPDALFARDFNEALVHQIVVAFQANARLGTRAQKDRGAVNHSTRKPWRQKGTGRARAGMTSSPLWRGGGKIFPNSPDENFSHKVNRKMYRAGLCSILSQLAREDRVRVVDDFRVAQPKTKLLAQKVRSMGFDGVLVITDEIDQNLRLSSRNLPNVEVIAVRHANPVALVRFPSVLLTKAALAKLEEMLK